MIASQQEMNTYVGDIWIILDKTEYLIKCDKMDALYDFVCTKREISGRLEIHVEIYHTTKNDELHIDKLSRLASNNAAYRTLYWILFQDTTNIRELIKFHHSHR